MSVPSTYSKAGMLLTRSNLTNNMYFELFTSVATARSRPVIITPRNYSTESTSCTTAFLQQGGRESKLAREAKELYYSLSI